MSVLKNIWRPEDPPRKGPGPHTDSVLTERLAELLGRELEELQSSQTDHPKDSLEQSAVADPVNRESRAPAKFSPAASAFARPTQETETEEREHYLPASPSHGGSRNGEDSVRMAVDEALLHIRAFEEQAEAKLRSRLEDYAQALETAGSGIERSGKSGNTIEEMNQQFRTEARSWFDEARRELREQLEMSRSSLENELKRSQGELLDAAQQKIEAMARASIEANAQASRQQDLEQVERWISEQAEASRRQAEAATQNLMTATEQALGRLHAFEERIEAGFRSQVEEYRQAVQAAAKELKQEGISQAQFQQAAEELRRLTDQALDRSTKAIQDHAEQSMMRLSQKLSTVEQSLGAAARAAMEGALLEHQHRLSEAWIEKSRTAVETVAQAGREGQAQVEAARTAAEEEVRNAVREQGRRVMEEAAAEFTSGSFRNQMIDDATRQMQETARDVLARSTEDLSKKSQAAISGLTATLHTTADKFLSEVQQRLNEAGKSWFDSAGQSVQKEFQAQMAGWIEEQTRSTERRAEEAARTVATLTDQAAARLDAVSRETEALLRRRVQEQQQQWLESALEQARKSGFQQKVINQALAEMEVRATQLQDQATHRLAEHAESSRAALAGEMDAAAKKLLDGAEASLEKISWQHRGRLAQWWEERNQMARRESEAATAALTEASQQATNQLRSVQSEMETELANRAREHQARLLEAAMEEMRRSGTIERAASEAALTLRTNANEMLVRSNEQIRDQMEAARLAMENHAQASRRGLAEDLAKKVEQAQSSVEAAGKAVTEDYRRELSVWWEERTQSARRENEEASSSLSRAARQASEQLEATRKEVYTELQSGLQNYRQGLRDAAADELRRQGFQKSLLDSISAELDKSSRELAERSTRELQQHVETSLSGLDEKMKANRQAFLDDTQKQLADLARTSMEMTTSRFHEMLTKNAHEIEREQEEWLQRKREAVWLEINQRSAAPGDSKLNAPLTPRTAQKKPEARSGGVLSAVLTGAAIIAMAAALTAVFVRLAPRRAVTMELRAGQPAGFTIQNPRWGAKESAQQMQIANAYWLVAINDLQHKYPFNTALPADPPPDFTLSGSGLKDNAATQKLYWDKIRQIWAAPNDWQQVAVDNGNPITSALNWLKAKLTQPQASASSGN